MSNYLAIDTSSGYLTVFARKERISCMRYTPDCAMKHSVILMDEIDKAMDEIGLKPDECDFFAAVTGPGSFTGIRIGIAAAKGLSKGAGKRTVGVTSFDLAAYNVTGENFIVAADAGRGMYYMKGYGSAASDPSYVDGEKIESFKVPVYGFSDLPLNLYTKLDPSECIERAAVEAEKRGGKLEALYVRKSQAEEEREK